MPRFARIPVLAVLVALASPGLADAGPITWSYSTQGGELDGYFLTDVPTTVVNTESGQRSYLVPYSGYGPNTRYTPEPVGPVMARVTLTDLASEDSAVVEVPYYFTGTDEDVVHPFLLLGFEQQTIQLGDNSYTIKQLADPHDQTIVVEVSSDTVQTPEPASIALACIGLTGAGAMRMRRRFFPGRG